MIASRVVALIEKHSDELARGLMERVAADPNLADIRRVPMEELQQRAYEIYHNISDWILTTPEAEVSRCFLAVGGRRALQGVSIGTLIGTLLIVKEHLYEFVKREALADRPVELFEEMELFHLLDQYFDRALYHAARGYERVAARAA